MTSSNSSPSVADVFRHVTPFIILALGLLALTFVVPYLNPYGSRLLDLTGPAALLAYYLTVSGSGSFGPLTATAIVIYVALRPGLGLLRRIGEFVVMYGVVLLIVQLWVNIEPVVKRTAQQVRPVIWELSHKPDGAPSLQMTEDQFYAIPPQQRFEQLKKVLSADFKDIKIDARIREHWWVMTDYGFPSGHSVGAMLNAFLFLTLGFYLLPKNWQWPMYLMFAWMIAICYSRTMLREHAAIQVFGGGSIGIVLGVITFLVIQILLKIFFKIGARSASPQASAA